MVYNRSIYEISLKMIKQFKRLSRCFLFSDVCKIVLGLRVILNYLKLFKESNPCSNVTRVLKISTEITIPLHFV